MSEEATATEEVAVKRPKKLSKSIVNETTVRIEVLGYDSIDYDFNDLTPVIQEKFGPFGLSHKLGDSAAGKVGQEAVDAINAVWEGLLKGDWSTRAPAQKKLSKSEAEDTLSNMSEEEAAEARAVLEKFGLFS